MHRRTGRRQLTMETQPPVLGDRSRYRVEDDCTVTLDQNPYRPGPTVEEPLHAGTPAWKRTLASLLRISGGIVIAIPLVAFAFDLPDADINYYLSDAPAIITALFCYFGFGSLLIILGNKLSPKGRKPEARHGVVG